MRTVLWVFVLANIGAAVGAVYVTLPTQSSSLKDLVQVLALLTASNAVAILCVLLRIGEPKHPAPDNVR